MLPKVKVRIVTRLACLLTNLSESTAPSKLPAVWGEHRERLSIRRRRAQATVVGLVWPDTQKEVTAFRPRSFSRSRSALSKGCRRLPAATSTPLCENRELMTHLVVFSSRRHRFRHHWRQPLSGKNLSRQTLPDVLFLVRLPLGVRDNSQLRLGRSRKPTANGANATLCLFSLVALIDVCSRDCGPFRYVGFAK